MIDIRFILMDRLIRIDDHMRNARRLGPEDNPPYLPISAAEAEALGATACEDGKPTTAAAFYGVPLRIVSSIDPSA